MPIQVYNSLTRRKEVFAPLKEGQVNMYTCGVTVYDSCHIGHARSLYIFDVIRRYLQYKGYQVNFVRNITDIDDKIINRSKELGVSWQDLVGEFIERYYHDLRGLGIEPGIKDGKYEPRATNNIQEMIDFIKKLIDKDYAYEVEGDVYFKVRQFKQYGKLSGQSPDQMLEAVRIDEDKKKNDKLDFALWKKSKEGEPSWGSPWGKGRPGWHIECSVMSLKYLKTETLDIHAGGRDLIFPHHENEIAQTEALSGKDFAKYWIHHGLLTINSQKMAKSLNNFITIQDVLKKYPADILKMFYLGAHYSSSIDFSWERMEEVKKAYERIDILRDKLQQRYGTVDITEEVKGGAGDIQKFKLKFTEYMDDDFNMPKALGVLFDMINRCNVTLESDIQFKKHILTYALSTMKEICGIFGLDFLKKESDIISDKDINFQIAARAAYKENKQFDEADKIRKELEEKGIILEDTKEGTTWRRKI